MIDFYTKAVLTIIAVSLVLLVADRAVDIFIPDAVAAQGTVRVYVEGGRLDYETDVSGGPTLKVCTAC